MTNFYGGDKDLNITKREEVLFKTLTNYSDKKTFNLMGGFGLEYCSNREVLYIFPLNSRNDKHRLRWTSVEKNDIKSLIKTLEQFI